MIIEPHHLNFLVVDDDPFMLLLIRKQLERLRVGSIEDCSNAKAALETIRQSDNYIDIIISDLNMPGMDGVELFRHLTHLQLDIGIILISAAEPRILETVYNLAKYQKLNILGTLNKPFNEEQLKNLIDSYRPITTYEPAKPSVDVNLQELQQAIEGQQIQAYFQPQVSLHNGRLIGAEALAHWKHPSKGNIPADRFISMAEQHQLIHPITEAMLDFCCRQQQLWLKQGLDIFMSVNISPKILDQLDLPETLLRLTEKYDLQPQKIIIEVTESAIMADIATSIEILSRIRLKGFALSIDDYGTGYSSLEKLRQIPFTELKIDKSFIHHASDDHANRVILESVVDLAKRLRLKCVAEGIEDKGDWQLVKELGCDIAQGFYISRPIRADKFIDWATSAGHTSWLARLS